MSRGNQRRRREVLRAASEERARKQPMSMAGAFILISVAILFAIEIILLFSLLGM